MDAFIGNTDMQNPFSKVDGNGLQSSFDEMHKVSANFTSLDNIFNGEVSHPVKHGCSSPEEYISGEDNIDNTFKYVEAKSVSTSTSEEDIFTEHGVQGPCRSPSAHDAAVQASLISEGIEQRGTTTPSTATGPLTATSGTPSPASSTRSASTPMSSRTGFNGVLICEAPSGGSAGRRRTLHLPRLQRLRANSTRFSRGAFDTFDFADAHCESVYFLGHMKHLQRGGSVLRRSPKAPASGRTSLCR